MKQWEGKEIANIMNNAIEGWKPHGTHRFGKEYGIQRSWKRMEDSVKKDKDGFMAVSYTHLNKLEFWTKAEYDRFIAGIELGSEDYLIFEMLFWRCV